MSSRYISEILEHQRKKKKKVNDFLFQKKIKFPAHSIIFLFFLQLPDISSAKLIACGLYNVD